MFEFSALANKVSSFGGFAKQNGVRKILTFILLKHKILPRPLATPSEGGQAEEGFAFIFLQPLLIY